MTNPSESSLKKRSRRSFAILFLGLALAYFGWHQINHADEDLGTPAPYRKVLELNGRLWKSFFKPERLATCKPPRTGKSPRVNGDIGLEKPVDLEHWKMTVMADDQDEKSRRIELTMADLKALPRTDSTTEFRCIEGWSDEISYAGVKFSDFMKAYHLSPKTYVGLETEDGEYYVSIDMESMDHPQTLLAYEMNGMPLSDENGAPLRLVIPVKYGIKNLKRVGKIFFSDVRPRDYWNEQGYDWYAGL